MNRDHRENTTQIDLSLWIKQADNIPAFVLVYNAEGSLILNDENC